MNEHVDPSVVPSLTIRPRPHVELGRRAEVRVEKFLDAASAVFAEKGYERAKLSDIVARAGGSLATLYRVFGDKEGLAYAITERHLSDLATRLQQLDLSGLDPEKAMLSAARQLADNLATADSRVLHRIVIGEGTSFPQLRDWFFENAIAIIRGKLSSYFEEANASGQLKIGNPANAAPQFFSMLFGNWIISITSGRQNEIERAELDEYTTEAVKLFLYGALPR